MWAGRTKDTLSECRDQPKEFQHRTDQLMLGLGFVGSMRSGADFMALADAIPEDGKPHRLGERGSPLGRALYAVGEEAMGESVAWHLLFLTFKRAVDRVSDKVASMAPRFVRSIDIWFPFTPEGYVLGIYMDLPERCSPGWLPGLRQTDAPRAGGQTGAQDVHGSF